jgi:hypothetical protein
MTAMADNIALPDPNAHVQALIRANPDELLELWNLWYRNDAELRLAVLEEWTVASITRSQPASEASVTERARRACGRELAIASPAMSWIGFGRLGLTWFLAEP